MKRNGDKSGSCLHENVAGVDVELYKSSSSFPMLNRVALVSFAMQISLSLSLSLSASLSLSSKGPNFLRVEHMHKTVTN